TQFLSMTSAARATCTFTCATTTSTYACSAAALKEIRCPRFRDVNLNPERRPCGLRLLEQSEMALVCGIQQDGNACETDDHLAQQLEAPAGQVRRQKTHAGDVPAWPAEARNETARQRIVTEPDDRDGLGGIFRGLHCRRALGHDGIDSQSHQFRGELWQGILFAVSITILEGDVLPFDPAVFLQSLNYGLERP